MGGGGWGGEGTAGGLNYIFKLKNIYSCAKIITCNVGI